MVKRWSLVFLCALFCTNAPADVLKRKPVVYLTFDDGPSSDRVTEMVLDVLARHNARATFFVTGARARANPEKILKIIEAGHVLGNHTHSHAKLTTLSDHEVAQELSDTNRHVYSAGGPALNCFRAPFGSTNQRVNNVALGMGLRKVGWSIDTRDWDPFVESTQIAVQLEDSQNNSIVLMHDGPKSRWRTLEVFTRWIEDTAGTYNFEALPDCVQPVEQSYAFDDRSNGMQKKAPTAVAMAAKVAKQPMGRGVPSAPSVSLTVPLLLNKLRSYEIALQPEVVAQNGIKNSAQF